MAKKTILIDLDGILNLYDGNFNKNDIPDIKQGAKEFLEKLSADYELYLFTTRNLLLSVKWLEQNNIDMFFKDVTNIKIPAYLNIDDRTICFKGNFDSLFDEINLFKTHWQS